MYRALSIQLALFIFAAATAPAGSPTVRYRVTELEMIPASSVCPCFDSVAINNANQVVGHFYDPSGNRHSFFWEAGTMVDIGTLGGAVAQVRGLNDLGQAVGYAAAADNPQRTFRYAAGQMEDLGTLGGTFSLAGDINSVGQIVGNAERNGPDDYEHAFIWEEGPGNDMTDLGTLGGPFSDAVAINEGGTIVGSSWNAAWDIHAVVWNVETHAISDLGTLGDPTINNSAARAINDQGLIVGYSQTDDRVDGQPTSHAVLWQNGQMIDMGLLAEAGEGCNPYSSSAHTSTVAHAINNAGVIVGNSFPINTCAEPLRPGPFVYRDGQMTNLNDLLTNDSGQWIILSAADINDAGVIAGSARTRADHHSRAVMLTPVLMLPADANCDGSVNFFDIDPFLLALFNPALYATTFPDCDVTSADCNNSGDVNFFDIDPFLACLFDTCP